MRLCQNTLDLLVPIILSQPNLFELFRKVNKEVLVQLLLNCQSKELRSTLATALYSISQMKSGKAEEQLPAAYFLQILLEYLPDLESVSEDCV